MSTTRISKPISGENWWLPIVNSEKFVFPKEIIDDEVAPFEPPDKKTRRSHRYNTTTEEAIEALIAADPLKRINAAPNKAATIAVTAAPTSRDKGNDIPNPGSCPGNSSEDRAQYEETRAPTPIYVACVKEICPVNPVKINKPIEAMVKIPARVAASIRYLVMRYLFYPRFGYSD